MLRGLPWLGPALGFGASGTGRAPLTGVLLCFSVWQALLGALWLRPSSGMQRARPSSASLLFSCWCWRVGRAATVMPPPPTLDSQCRLASTAASFSSTGLSPHDLLSHVPQAVSPQSSANLAWVCSTTAALQLPAAGPSRGPLALSGVCMAVERIVCVILIQFRPSWIICFTFSLKCFPSDPNNCPTVGTGPLLQFPHPPRAGPVLLTLPFCPQLPSSY